MTWLFLIAILCVRANFGAVLKNEENPKMLAVLNFQQISDISQFPWLALLASPSNDVSGVAVIVNKFWVVSTVQAIQDNYPNPKDINVWTGVGSLNDITDPNITTKKKHTGKFVKIHPNFDRDFRFNNIALLKVCPMFEANQYGLSKIPDPSYTFTAGSGVHIITYRNHVMQTAIKNLATPEVCAFANIFNPSQHVCLESSNTIFGVDLMNNVITSEDNSNILGFFLEVGPNTPEFIGDLKLFKQWIIDNAPVYV